MHKIKMVLPIFSLFLFFYVHNLSGQMGHKSSIEDYSSILKKAIDFSIENPQDTQAIKILKLAIEQTEKNYQVDSLLALTYNQLGNQYYDQYDDVQAMNQWQKALDIRILLHGQLNEDVIKSQTNIGLILLYQRKLETAREIFQTAIINTIQLPKIDTLVLIDYYNNLAHILNQQGDLHNAKIQLEESLRLHKGLKLSSNKYLDLYECFVDYYTIQEEGDSMIAFNNDILAIDLSKEDSIRTYTNMGAAYVHKDSILQSEEFYQKAIKLLDESTNNFSQPYRYISIAQRKLGKPKIALVNVNKAIEIDRYNQDLMGLAESFNTQAMAYLALKKTKKASVAIDTALSYFQDTLHITDKPLYVTILKDKIKILRQFAKEQNDITYLEEAISITDKAVNVIDEIRQDYQSDISKRFLSKKSILFFEEAIQLNWQLYQTTQDQKYAWNAFEMSERSKSVIVLEAVLAAKAKSKQTTLNEFFLREATIKRQITDIEVEKENLLDPLDAAKNLELNNDLARLNNDLVLQKKIISQKDPLFYDNIYHSIDYKNVNDLPIKLDNDLIEFFVGELFSYAFVIKNGMEDITFIQLPVTNDDLEQGVKSLRHSISYSVNTNYNEEKIAYKEEFVKYANQLYLQLIQPIESISNLDAQLTIIPDGILGYIPFEVLLKKEPETIGAWHTYDYLIDSHSITYTYSVSLLNEMKNVKIKSSNKSFFGLAPSFPETESWLKPLTNNKQEINSIQDMIGGTIFTGQKATKPAFISMASNHSIIHLATHGKANDLQGDYSCLAFTKMPEDSISDQLLYNRELYDLKLNAEMVVLSACETGTGELEKGEGIISLARGFSYAGAKSIVTTLWSINDTNIGEIMVSFYQNLKNGDTKDLALHKAKIDFKNNNPMLANPYYWAAFTLVGDNSPVSFANTSFYSALLYLSVFIFFVLGFVYFRHKTKTIN